MNQVQVLPPSSDSGADGKVYAWVLGKWFDEARQVYLQRVYQCCEEMDVNWVAASQRIDYFHECIDGAEVKLEVAVSEVNRHSVLLGCRISQNGKLCAVGSCEMESRDRSYNRPLPLTDGARKNLEDEALGFLRIKARGKSYGESSSSVA